jgi:hypothetical protein
VFIPDQGIIPSLIDDLCHTTLPLDFKSAVSGETTRGGLTRFSPTNRFPIVAILSFISVDLVFNLLSKVRLLDMYESDNPQAFITFL